MYTDSLVERLLLPADLKAALQACRCLVFPESLEELREMAYGPARSSRYEVCYPIPDRGLVMEAEVLRCKNGAVYRWSLHEPYLSSGEGTWSCPAFFRLLGE